MMGEWQDVIDYTADRAALAVTGDPRLVNATIVKAAVAADPNSGVTMDEIENYLSGPERDTLNTAAVEQRFKLNRFIEAQPNLHNRIEQVVEFYQSPEGQKMLERLAKDQKRTLPKPPAPARKDEVEAEFIPGEPEEMEP